MTPFGESKNLMEETLQQVNRIDALFSKKREDILSVYFTAGYPALHDTTRVMKALETAGADLIEVGIPFSDPIADGPTIQASNEVALGNGIDLATILEQLKGIRAEVSIPIVLMGYINPIVQYGVERFCAACKEIGVDGLILPDLPMYEYLQVYKAHFDAAGLYNIYLITPQTSEARIREIDQNTNGFIYMVSSASITGARSEISDQQVSYFERVRAMHLKNPQLIGFGISNRETYSQACQYANGAIIGSAFIKVLQNSTNLEQDITAYIHAVKGIAD